MVSGRRGASGRGGEGAVECCDVWTGILGIGFDWGDPGLPADCGIGGAGRGFREPAEFESERQCDELPRLWALCFPAGGGVSAVRAAAIGEWRCVMLRACQFFDSD